MMRTFCGWYFDREGTAPAPPEFAVIETERVFLECLVADQVERLLIRGQSLCDWAFEVASARSIEFADAPDPVRLLASRYPSLDHQAAHRLTERLGEESWNDTLLSQPRELLQKVGPEFGAVWSRPASAEHAADWLVWWTNTRTDLAPIASVLGERIASSVSDPFLKRCYTVEGSTEALRLLSEWVGIEETHDALPEWQATYLSTSDEASQQLRTSLLGRLRQILTHEGPGAAQRMLISLRDSRLQSGFAADIALYLGDHRDHISESAVGLLAPYLERDTLDHLRAKLPVPAPQGLPESADDLIGWYEQQYRPWLMWSLAHARDDDTHQRIGAEFSERYLQAFQHILNADGSSERIAWQRSASLRKHAVEEQGSNTATLLLVLDGVGPNDVDELLKGCRELIPSLMTTSVDWALVAPPSATPFTKPTVIAGRPSVDADDASADFRGMKTTAQIVEALRLQSFVTWSLEEPDKSYHRATLEQDLRDVNHLVRSELRTTASLLQRIVSELGPSFRLNVVITADHGRLLINSSRTEPAPNGLRTHGRSAWGVPATPKQFSSAYERDGNLIWLNPSAFFLPEGHAYVVRSDTLAFSPVNNAGGLEVYPHGGLYPEEVMVPWVTMETQVEAPDLAVFARGSGTTGAMGELVLSIANPSRYSVVLEQLELEDDIVLSGPVVSLSPFQNAEATFPVQNWPAASSLELRAIFRLPSGEHFIKNVTARLETRALYKQNDPLADLEF